MRRGIVNSRAIAMNHKVMNAEDTLIRQYPLFELFYNFGIGACPKRGPIVSLISPTPLYIIKAATNAPIYPSKFKLVNFEMTAAIKTARVAMASFLESAEVASRAVEFMVFPALH